MAPVDPAARNAYGQAASKIYARPCGHNHIAAERRCFPRFSERKMHSFDAAHTPPGIAAGFAVLRRRVLVGLPARPASPSLSRASAFLQDRRAADRAGVRAGACRSPRRHKRRIAAGVRGPGAVRREVARTGRGYTARPARSRDERAERAHPRVAKPEIAALLTQRKQQRDDAAARRMTTTRAWVLTAVQSPRSIRGRRARRRGRRPQAGGQPDRATRVDSHCSAVYLQK